MEREERSYIKNALEPLVWSTEVTGEILVATVTPLAKNVLVPLWRKHVIRNNSVFSY